MDTQIELCPVRMHIFQHVQIFRPETINFYKDNIKQGRQPGHRSGASDDGFQWAINLES